jgi:[acyl-carrier-protein] S-malonyltransferase
VVSGDKAAVERAVEIAKQKGAKRAMMLTVSAPFHCALMRPAQERLAEVLKKIEVQDPRFPIVANVTADVTKRGGRERDLLIEQVTAPVRWMESIRCMIDAGASTFVEVGPGKVLSGLLRQMDRAQRCVNVEDSASLEKALTGS